MRRTKRKLWQEQHKQTWRRWERYYEEHLVKSIQAKKKKFSKSRKSARDAVGRLNNEGGKRDIKQALEVAEKLNTFFASPVTAENLG